MRRNRCYHGHTSTETDEGTSPWSRCEYARANPATHVRAKNQSQQVRCRVARVQGRSSSAGVRPGTLRIHHDETDRVTATVSGRNAPRSVWLAAMVVPSVLKHTASKVRGGGAGRDMAARSDPTSCDEISVGGSCSARNLPGRWQFRRVLPGLAVVGRAGK